MRYINFIFLFVLASSFSHVHGYHPHPKKHVKPYMNLDMSQDWRVTLPAPFEEEKVQPGVALNFGFRF